ncbi:MAG: hypothetical protein ABEH59_02075 [Halobacteriales archaeon]
MAGFLNTESVPRTPLYGGLLGGLVHAGLASALWTVLGLDDLAELAAVKALYGLYVLFGMFALGFVPSVFYIARGRVLPALVVASFLILSTAASWRAGPAEAPQGGPTPFAFYILLWIVIVVLAALVARFEESRVRASTQ